MRRSAVGVFILGIGLFESNTDFFQKNGADIERAVRGDRRRRSGSSELSGKIEHHSDVEVHYRNVSSGYSRRRDAFFIEKSSMDVSFESSTDSFPYWVSFFGGEYSRFLRWIF